MAVLGSNILDTPQQSEVGYGLNASLPSGIRLHALLYAGHDTRDSGRWALVMYVYGDLSRTPTDPVMTAGCYLAKESDLQRANAAWQALLDEALSHLPRTKREFHATDFFAGWGAFKGWDPKSDKHRDFALRFASVATDSHLIGFSFAVDNLRFGEILAPILATEDRKYSSADLRVFCAMKALALVHEFLYRANHSTPPPWMKHAIQVILEEEQGFGRYQDFFGESQGRNEKWTWWFSGISPGKKSILPIQMADLLAHQAHARALDVRKDKNAQLSPVFARMIQDGRVALNWFGEADAEANAELFLRILRAKPRGLVTDVELAQFRAASPKGIWERFRNWLARIWRAVRSGPR